LKRIHKELTAQAHKLFKDKAIGDELEQYQKKIEQEIQSEYQRAKEKCKTDSKKQCEKAIKKELDQFHSDVRLGKFQTEMELNQKVDILKATFKEAVASINYREKAAYLEQVCANLINTGLRNLL